jgi:hypothetical protein
MDTDFRNIPIFIFVPKSIRQKNYSPEAFLNSYSFFNSPFYYFFRSEYNEKNKHGPFRLLPPLLFRDLNFKRIFNAGRERERESRSLYLINAVQLLTGLCLLSISRQNSQFYRFISAGPFSWKRLSRDLNGLGALEWSPNLTCSTWDGKKII